MTKTTTLPPLSIEGATRVTTFHHKAVNMQAGSFILHKGVSFFITREAGICAAGRARVEKCKLPHELDPNAPELKDVIFLDPDQDIVIDGRFFGWQVGGKYWLWITTFPMTDKPSKTYMVRYQEL